MKLYSLLSLITILLSYNAYAVSTDKSQFNNKALFLKHSGKHHIVKSFGESNNACIAHIQESFKVCVALDKDITIEQHQNSVEIKRGNDFLYIRHDEIEPVNNYLCNKGVGECDKYTYLTDKSKIHKFYNAIIKITPYDLLNANKEEIETIKNMLVRKSMLVLKDATEIKAIDIGDTWTGIFTKQYHKDTGRGFYINLFNNNKHLLILGRGINVNYK